MKWLFHAANAPLPEDAEDAEGGVEIFNMRDASAEDTVAGLLGKKIHSSDNGSDNRSDTSSDTMKSSTELEEKV